MVRSFSALAPFAFRKELPSLPSLASRGFLPLLDAIGSDFFPERIERLALIKAAFLSGITGCEDPFSFPTVVYVLSISG